MILLNGALTILLSQNQQIVFPVLCVILEINRSTRNNISEEILQNESDTDDTTFLLKVEMKVLSNGELHHVHKDLENYFPKSMQMHYMIGNRINERGDWPGTEFVVDRYPDYSVLIRRPIANSRDYIPWPRGYCVVIFCKDAGRLEQFIQTDGCIDFSQPVLFFGLSRNDVFPIVLNLCKSLGTIDEQDPPDWANVYLLHPGHLTQRSLPEGFRLGQLSLEHAEQVNSEWHYGDEATVPFFQQIIRHYPTSAIFTEENRLVAYIMNHPDGCMGHGYVQPEYRNRGLYQVVNYDLAEKIVATGVPTAWAYVMKWNDASQGAYRKLGARKVDDEVYCVDWVHFHPKNWKKGNL